MADINIACPKCHNVITVSEFVDADFLTCMKCKAQVSVPGKVPETVVSDQPKLRLTLKKEPAPPPPSPAPEKGRKRAKADAARDVRNYMPKGGKARRARRVSTFEVAVLPWLVFVVLAVLLTWFRFAPPDLLNQYVAPDLFVTCGIWALLFLHLSVVCLGFSDDAFQGLLCLIIPGYTLYYLFVQSDQMHLRAVVAALLLAFGWDAMIASKNLWNEIYINVSSWIATTETLKK